MGRVSQAIPNLFNGVSQQSPSIRLPSQGQAQINGYSSLVSGLGKRPPVNHLAEILDSPTDSKIFTHVINRDTEEQYILVLYDDSIKAFNLSDGSEVPIFGTELCQVGDQAHTGGNNADVLTDAGGYWETDKWIGFLILNVTDGSWGTITANTATTITATLKDGTENDWDTGDEYKLFQLPIWTNYLDVDTARSDFQAITVADYTFLVNKKLTAKEDLLINLSPLSEEGIVQWDLDGVLLVSGGYDPYGEEEGVTIKEDNSDGFHFAYQTLEKENFEASTPYYVSAWFKKVTGFLCKGPRQVNF